MSKSVKINQKDSDILKKIYGTKNEQTISLLSNFLINCYMIYSSNQSQIRQCVSLKWVTPKTFYSTP